MRDPLHAFDWSQLYERYDALCVRLFDPLAPQLKTLMPRPQSDRDLYYQLLNLVHAPLTGKPALSIDLYEALLYWKFYSHPAAVRNLQRWFAPEDRSAQTDRLAQLVDDLPGDLQRDAKHVTSLVEQLGTYRLAGIKTKTALPTRTTFLHFIFPDVVPIFDRMVLQAVGVDEPDANQRMDVLRHYLPFAWELADRHAPRLVGYYRETPVRLIDMALWVVSPRRGPRKRCDIMQA